MSAITITFPGGKRVDAQVGRHVVRTDQPVAAGGEDSAPAPFDLFLASLGACAGIYVLGFCQARGLPTDGVVLRQQSSRDSAGALQVAITIELPPGFPSKYADALVRVAEGCAVKKAIAAGPAITVRTELASRAA